MNISKYKKLQKEFEVDNFERNYHSINSTLYYSSYFGNIASVIFAYFFLSNIVEDMQQWFSGQMIIVSLMILIFLCGFELLKRFVFKRFVSNCLVSITVNIRMVLSLLFVFMLVSGSFYLSLNGAQRLVDRSQIISNNVDSLHKAQSDSIYITYQKEIDRLQSYIDINMANAKDRWKWGLKQREEAQLIRWEGEIKEFRRLRREDLEKFEKQFAERKESLTSKTTYNQWAFVLIASFIEILILTGVGFNVYYLYYSCKQYERILSKNPNYFKYKIFVKLLGLLYQNGAKRAHETLTTFIEFRDLVTMIDVGEEVSESMLYNFLTVCNSLGITRVQGNKRLSLLSYEEATEKISKYFWVN